MRCPSVVYVTVLMAAGAAAQGEVASGKSSAEVRELFRQARALYQEHRYAAAVAKFEQVFELSPSTVVSFNIGRCHERLGDVGKALRAYRDYLRQSPHAADADAVKGTIANLERRLRETGVQQLLVFTEPARALVEVDGKVIGTSPASVELVAGSHRLVVSASGFQSEELSFSMDLKRSMERTVTLKAAPASAPAPAAGPVASASDAPREASETREPLVPRVEASRHDGAVPVVTATRPGRVAAYVVGGLGVASLATAIVLGVEAQRTAAGVSTAPIGTAPGAAQNAHTLAACSNGAYGLAGAAAVTAVVLFLVEAAR